MVIYIYTINTVYTEGLKHHLVLLVQLNTPTTWLHTSRTSVLICDGYII